MKALSQIFLFFALLFPIVLKSQQRDFVGLTGINVSKILSRSWDVSLGAQTMFNQNLSELWIGFGDVSVGYKINRNLQTELHYRSIRFRTLENDYEKRSLFYHTLTYYKSFGKFSFSIRNRLQQLVYGEHFNDSYRGPRWYNRDKFQLKYRINYYWAPFISTELFYPLNHPTRKNLDQYRAAIGISYSWSDNFRLEPYYQLQQQIHRVRNNANFLIGINAIIKIP